MYSYYKPHDYAVMISDTRRMESYAKALRHSIRTGYSVLDIGSGSGVFSLLACQFGAEKVVAVEPNAIIEIARSLAAANGLGDRIEFVHGMTTDLDLGQRFDIIVSDLRGTTPMHGKHLHSIIDARERLLEPDGLLIPQSDRMMVAGVGDADFYGSYVRPWPESFGLNLEPLAKALGRAPQKTRFAAEQITLEEQCWAVLDYDRINSADVAGTAEWSLAVDTSLFGFVVWFDSTLTTGIEYSNAPGLHSMVYGNLFLPLPEPVDLKPGDNLSVEISAEARRKVYRWQWRGFLSRDGGPAEVLFAV